LPPEEVARQVRAWRQISFPRGSERMFLDASRDLEDLAGEVERRVMRLLDTPSGGTGMVRPRNT
jgi:hypothetical protein